MTCIDTGRLCGKNESSCDVLAKSACGPVRAHRPIHLAAAWAETGLGRCWIAVGFSESGEMRNSPVVHCFEEGGKAQPKLTYNNNNYVKDNKGWKDIDSNRLSSSPAIHHYPPSSVCHSGRPSVISSCQPSLHPVLRFPVELQPSFHHSTQPSTTPSSRLSLYLANPALRLVASRSVVPPSQSSPSIRLSPIPTFRHSAQPSTTPSSRLYLYLANPALRLVASRSVWSLRLVASRLRNLARSSVPQFDPPSTGQPSCSRVLHFRFGSSDLSVSLTTRRPRQIPL
ncbi:hypothetical protein BV898_09392 [Hypsibius exemplaris]|uniref:DOMON domain-containing protein n=1 Tax=Hypsibius exemplaris TaxID=2072580 RepID=A0A1W0WMG4_HYPEX|nr:hypothetical protein BV898_09392 [Hypsibius exemplaris]